MGKREYEALIILAVILLSAILGIRILPSFIGTTAYQNIFKPLFWFALSVYIWKQPRVRFKGKLKLHKYILIWSAICGIVYMAIFFAGGFMDGIGASPYSRSITGMLVNVLSFGSVIVMMEWVRNYIINKVKKKYLIQFSILVVIIFTFYRLNLRILMSVENWQQVIRYVGEYAGPEIALNILMAYMVYIGGERPAIIYMALTNLPIWISPLLPNLRWITKAFIGIMSPVIFFIMLRQIYKKQAKEVKIREQKSEKPTSWIAVSVFSIALIWFAVGVFPIYPVVILTGSMQPAIDPGDIVLLQRTDGQNLKVGEIIQYWTGEIFIVHRIISIDQATGRYQTKGDSNSAPDSVLVGPEQIKGKLISVIPKVGKLSIWLRRDYEYPEEQVEF
ncbi:MAG TPA: signal peptidase I [Clostridiaceae bacterium]|nr:signal peptidase I [Clostridiaceae bacterium]